MNIRQKISLSIVGLIAALSIADLCYQRNRDISRRVAPEIKYECSEYSFVTKKSGGKIHLWPNECGDRISYDDRAFYMSLEDLSENNYKGSDFCRLCASDYYSATNSLVP
jgi:hypothetical protein